MHAMVNRTVVVFAGGSRPGADSAAFVPPGALVVAADSGAEHALALGLPVEIAIGDFDSITPDSLAALERAGTRLERHPIEKNATDLELALDAALALQPRRIVVVGGAEGRLDHLLGEVLLLSADAYAGVEVDALLGGAMLHLVRRERVLTGDPGELISLFALQGPAVGVVTEGLAYPLRGETLAPGSSRGISNVFSAAEARIGVERGAVLVVRPGRD
jgi:thiamine pyrophosphokinase